MTKEIMEGNAKIAEFMGAVWKKDDFGADGYAYHENKPPTGIGSGYEIKALKYHSSWDWLMPVVEKIESLFNDSVMFNINSHKSFIELDTQRSIAYNLPEMPDFYSGLCDSKIQAVYKTILQFIDWYKLTVTSKD